MKIILNNDYVPPENIPINVDFVENVKFYFVHGNVTYKYKIPTLKENKSAYFELDCDFNMPQNEIMFLVLDTLYNDAFGHWVFESAVFLSYAKNLLNKYQNLFILCEHYKKFKILFLDFFNIPKDRVIFASDKINNEKKASTFIFPSPITSWHDNAISTNYTNLIYKFFSYFNNEVYEKIVEYLIMPRQTKENYVFNDRSIPLNQLCLFSQNKCNFTILHTDLINSLYHQIEIVKKAKTIFLTDGSPFLVNGMFAYHQNIVIVNDRITEDQGKCFKKIAYLIELIKKNNNVSYNTEKQILNSFDVSQ